MQLVKNLIYNLLSIQEHLLKNRLSKTLDAKQLSKRKRHYGNGCVLDLNSLADAEKQKLEDELYGILNTVQPLSHLLFKLKLCLVYYILYEIKISNNWFHTVTI